MTAPILLRLVAVSAFTSYTATTYLKPQWSTPAFSAYFAASFALAFLGWAVWAVILYPKFFSPLRGLPGPKNVSLRETGELQLLPKGIALMEWYVLTLTKKNSRSNMLIK